MTAKEKRVWAQYLREVSEALDRWADEPTKHGRWNEGSGAFKMVYAEHIYVCSKCHTGQPIKTKYCGSCGAKMDEVEE